MSKSHRNIIVVDSTPRSLSVYNSQQEKIGVTPFFYQVSPGHQQYFFRPSKIDSTFDRTLLTYKCQLNWYESIIPDAVWGVYIPIGTIMALGFTGIDALTGELFRCQNSIYFNISDRSSVKPNKKGSHTSLSTPYPEELTIDKILVVPPKWNEKPEMGKTVFDTWMGQQKESSEIKEKVLDYEISQKFFAFQNFSPENLSSPKSLNRSLLNEVGLYHGATHIILFSWQQKGAHHFLITPHLYEIYSLEEVHKSYLKPFVIKKERVDFPFMQRLLISLFPNTVGLDLTLAPEVNTVDPLYKTNYETKSHPRSLPKMISMLGLGSINHPQFYNPWDVAFTAAPSLGLTSWQSRATTSNSLSNYDYTINLENLKLSFYLTGIAHTPYGAFTLGVGEGPVYTYADDNKGYRLSRFDLATSVRLGYYAFLNDRFYLFSQLESVALNGDRISTPHFKLTQWSEIAFGIGHYLPEMKGIAAKWFKFN